MRKGVHEAVWHLSVRKAAKKTHDHTSTYPPKADWHAKCLRLGTQRTSANTYREVPKNELAIHTDGAEHASASLVTLVDADLGDRVIVHGCHVAVGFRSVGGAFAVQSLELVHGTHAFGGILLDWDVDGADFFDGCAIKRVHKRLVVVACGNNAAACDPGDGAEGEVRVCYANNRAGGLVDHRDAGIVANKREFVSRLVETDVVDPATTAVAGAVLRHALAEFHLLAPNGGIRLGVCALDVPREDACLEVRGAGGNKNVVWMPVQTTGEPTKDSNRMSPRS